MTSDLRLMTLAFGYFCREYEVMADGKQRDNDFATSVLFCLRNTIKKSLIFV